MQRTLYGNSSNNCCAYCKLHSCSLTVKQVRARECLAKQCWHLEKREHEWWKQRERIKEKRRSRKEAINNLLNAAG